MIMRFVELFGELSRIRAGLEVLVGKMRGIEGTEEDNQENGLEGVKKLRAEIRDKCFKKVSKAQAKVCLEKLKLQTANLEVGAGVMEKGLENEDDSDDHSNNFDVEFNEEIGLEVDVEVKFCPEETEKEKGDKKDTEWKPDTTTRYWSISTSAKVLNGLEYLQIHCDPESESLSLRELKTLGEWMPNLKTLRTILQRGSIAVICDQWPLLEHLAGMFGSRLTDKDITGTRKQGGKGLPDLVELKTFHLNLGCQDGRLTDVAAHSGFLKMKKLTDLQVSVGDEFSEDAKELLEDRFQNAVITGNHYGKHDWAGDDEDECCRNTTFMDFMHEELGNNLWGNNYYSSSEDDDMDEFNHQSEDEEDEEEEVVSQESQDNEKEQDGDDEKEQQ